MAAWSYIVCLTGTCGLVKDCKDHWTGEFDGRKVRFRLFVAVDRVIDRRELKTWSIMPKELVPAIDPGQANYCGQPIYVAHPQSRYAL